MGVGIEELLDGILQFLPDASAQETEELSGIVFKVEHDPEMGKAAYVRLFGGSLRNRASVVIPGSEEEKEEKEEKITQIRRFSGRKYQDLGELHAGEIGALYGLSSIRNGDVLGKIPLHRECSLATPLLMVKAQAESEEKRPALLTALRELSEEDLGSLGGTLMDAEAMAALGGAMDREQALTWLRRQIGRYRTGEPACWAVEERETGTPAGLAGFARMPTPLGELHELGYILRADRRGRGYASEAGRACLEYGFGTLGLPRACAVIRVGNAASERVARRLGMRYVREMEFRGAPHGLWLVSREDLSGRGCFSRETVL